MQPTGRSGARSAQAIPPGEASKNISLSERRVQGLQLMRGPQADTKGELVTVEIRLLGAQDGPVLRNVAADVFDHELNDRWSGEFLNDPRHHLMVALDDTLVVGFASAVHYVHPDKPPELWINEVGVAPSHQRQGVGRHLLDALLNLGSKLGCVQAWVLTSPSNTAAVRLYKRAGGEASPEPSILFEFFLAQGSP